MRLLELDIYNMLAAEYIYSMYISINIKRMLQVWPTVWYHWQLHTLDSMRIAYFALNWYWYGHRENLSETSGFFDLRKIHLPM